MTTTYASRLEQDPSIQIGTYPDTEHKILGFTPHEALQQYDLAARDVIGGLETMVALAQAAGVDDTTIAALGRAIPTVASSVTKFSKAPKVSLGHRVVNLLRKSRRE